jgi:hypothetical protein
MNIEAYSALCIGLYLNIIRSRLGSVRISVVQSAPRNGELELNHVGDRHDYHNSEILANNHTILNQNSPWKSRKTYY